MAKDKLSAKEVENAGDGTHNDGAGLNLRVKGKSRKWVFRFTRDGKVTELGLGSAETVSLKLARQLRDDHQTALAKGLDPRGERAKRATPRKTFAEAATDLIETRRSQNHWRPNATTGHESSLNEWTHHLLKVCAPIGKRLVGDLTKDDIKKIVKPYFDDGRTGAGRRLLKHIEHVFSYAKAHDWRASDNPASWEIFRHILQANSATDEKPNHPALDWRAMPEFMVRLRACRETMARLALEMMVLTACRSGEVRGMRWDELDLDAGLWTLPRGRMKRFKVHTVLLSTPAIALLKRLEAARTGNYVFPGRSGVISNVGVWEAAKALSDGRMSPHGARSSFSSWAAHRRIDSDFVEISLAHDIGSDVSRRYNREELLDHRRKLMQLWADFLGGKIESAEPAPSADIVDLPKLRLRA